MTSLILITLGIVIGIVLIYALKKNAESTLKTLETEVNTVINDLKVELEKLRTPKSSKQKTPKE